jgi:hypothetical protein
MAIFYAKYVTTIELRNGVLHFYLSSNGRRYSATWATDVEPTKSPEHSLSPTITSPEPNPQTGWLWLSEGWVGSNGVYSSTDPKRPKAFGLGDVYYRTNGTVVGVDVLVVLDEDKNGQPVRVNLYNPAELAPHVERPEALFGARGEFWLSSSFLVANTDVDFSALLSDEDAAAAACEFLEKLLGIPRPDAALVTQYVEARKAAATILDEYRTLAPNLPPPDLVERWRRMAHEALLDCARPRVK